jgi:hypothetical protein
MGVLVVIAVLILVSGSAFALESSSSQDSSSSPSNSSDLTGMEMETAMITHDPNTWPSGDLIWNIARAIAVAEGANVAGSNPDRLNNPGDISDGAKTYGSEFHTGSNVTHFPTKEIGWQWLYDKLQNIANGNSQSYSPDWTWKQIAQRWAGNWQAWAANVARELGVDENSTFGDYANS